MTYDADCRFCRIGDCPFHKPKSVPEPPKPGVR